MSVPISEEELFMVENAFEQSFKQILNRDGIANVNLSRSSDSEATPGITITFLTGQVTEGYRHSLGSDRVPAYAAWKGSQLIFQVITHRQNNADQHKIYLSKIRKNCQMYNLLRTWPTTQGARAHAIADIREHGQTHAISDDNDFDTTAMTFWVMHNLKNDAWPVNL
ncbi:MAG: hypothetical protein WC069_06190 [Candidatus Shapirobacteria bacterium]